MTTPTWTFDLELPSSGRFEVHDLSHPLHAGMPHHPMHPPFGMTMTKLHGEIAYESGVTASSEVIVTGGHVGTHVDALSHMAVHGRVHGGADILSAQSSTGGMEIHGAETLPPFLAPASVIDVPTLLGRPCDPDDAIGADLLDRWESANGPLDPIALIRTGWDELFTTNARFIGWGTGLPGVTLDGARWLTDRGVTAVGSDTIAFEKTPTESFPVHIHLLKDHGVPIMEVLDLRSLVGSDVTRCFFMAAPLRIVGATGSPMRPLGLVPARGVA